jgi:malonyl-CoA decarboxylase
LTQTSPTVGSKIIDLTLGNILSAWKGISTPFAVKRLELSPYLHEDEVAPLRDKINDCLDARGGEVSARARAAELGKAYLGLNDEGRLKFLKLLATEFDVDHDAVRTTAEALFTDLDNSARLKVEQRLRAQLKPPHLTLLTQFNALPQGIKFLVDLRADLLRFTPDNPELGSISTVLREQLSSWFDIGFLELREISWDAPASLLEKLIQYEAVHEIASWDDLRHRLAENRRCFAFFHPGMPDEPLIFIWVALVMELSDNVDTLLDTSQIQAQQDKPTNAIFYSISSAQQGLSGVSLGNFLIKRVVSQLRHELPSLEVFSTLSPITGFSRWLTNELVADQTILTDDEKTQLAKVSESSFADTLASDDWLDDDAVKAAMSTPLCRLVAKYLTTELPGRQRVTDAVGHFHLSNGARIERINWDADTSARGRKQSYGLMVNYLYDLAEIDSNHEQYITSGTVASSKPVSALVRQAGNT